MRIAGIREVRENTASLLNGNTPLLVTKHGKLSGVYLPLDNPDMLPHDLRAELASVLGSYLAAKLKKLGVSENDIQEDFNDFRRNRSRR